MPFIDSQGAKLYYARDSGVRNSPQTTAPGKPRFAGRKVRLSRSAGRR